jgi:hypothetical protein
MADLNISDRPYCCIRKISFVKVLEESRRYPEGTYSDQYEKNPNQSGWK